jgi:DnaJ-class molecular chaperone
MGPVRLAAISGASLGNVMGQTPEARIKKRLRNPNEKRCPACDGTGVLAAIQPVQPGRKLYPPPCKECGGRGRIPKTGN